MVKGGFQDEGGFRKEGTDEGGGIRGVHYYNTKIGLDDIVLAEDLAEKCSN